MSLPNSTSSQQVVPAPEAEDTLDILSTLTREEFAAKNLALQQVKDYIAELQASCEGNPFPFSKLPIELRFKIYKLARPGPRTIEVQFARKAGSKAHAFVTAEQLPMLYLNQESRAESLKMYQLVLFDAKSPGFGGVYMDCDIDRLYIRVGSRIQRAQIRFEVIEEMANKHFIKHLVLEINSIFSTARLYPPIPLQFPNLSTLTLLSYMDALNSRHIGKCDMVHRTACIHPIDETLAYETYHEVSNSLDHYVEARDHTKEFLDAVEAKEFGDITWNKPTVLYEGLCEEAVGSDIFRDKSSKFYLDLPPKPRGKPHDKEQFEREINELPKVYSFEEYQRHVRRIKHNFESRESVAKRKAGMTPAGVRDAERRAEYAKAMAKVNGADNIVYDGDDEAVDETKEVTADFEDMGMKDA